MRNMILLILLAAASGLCETSDQLPDIVVQEWGVITWNGDDPIVTSAPSSHELFPPFTGVTDPDGYAVRAPVLYFNGPEFTGTVTVQTDNGAIYDIYPPVEDENRTHSSVSWTCSFSNLRVEEYGDYRGLAPGEWNYGLWRVDPALTITREDGWQDKFLYYETAPETVDFLPYLPGAESVCQEYRQVPAMVIKRGPEGVSLMECTLGELVYGGDMTYADITPDLVMRGLFGWSMDLLEPEQFEAMWNTWSSWILYDHSGQTAYRDGLVLYLLPQELAGRISSVSVVPEETDLPVVIHRYLLVALPL